MTDLVNAYLPTILIAVVIALIVGFLIFRPRQRVRLNSEAPLRPHMTNSKDSPREANDIISEVVAATSDVTGEIIGAPIHKHLSNQVDPSDDLERIKGVGPKLAEMLNARGYRSFEQLARLTPEEVDILDQQLGAFRGRIQRDRIVEQAHYLARGDLDGFEQQFGKL